MSFDIVGDKYTDRVESKTPKMNGLCWVAGDSIAEHNIDDIVDLGATWISQTPFGLMNGHTDPNIELMNERAWWGETDKGIIYTAREAKKKGIKTMLKPHIWIRNSKGKWRSDIAMESNEEWDQWFESYKKWILHYARLAEQNQIEALCIGTEFDITTRRHPDKWRTVIAEIRKVYKGDLTYGANWYREYETVSFWDDLDFIGVQAYFPLVKENVPSKAALIKSWGKHKRSLKKLSEKYDKKIIFTEIGYKNTEDAAIEPWTWPQNLDGNTPISDATQMLCYEALFESLWHESWLEGFFIWKWFHTSYKYEDFDEYHTERQKRRKEWAKKRGRPMRPSIYFSPQYTDAREVLKKWYTTE